ncbi:MAG: FecR domain-containing protein [Bacteroidales bacterium]|nr:FecR domain-containing protein [Bacteroidales bacterium]
MNSKNKYNLITKILSESASEDEKRIFDNWLQENPDNKKEFDSIRVLWIKLNSQYKSINFDKEKAKTRIIEREFIRQSTIKLHRTYRLIAYAASIAVLIVGLTFLINKQETNKYISYYAGNEVKKVVLSDNSQIWLNKNARLNAPKQFKRNQRKVILSGEAFFEVTPNKESPFKVQTNKLRVKVLGTSFNILNDKDMNTSVSVETGLVSVSNSQNPFKKELLAPGFTAIYNYSENSLTKKVTSNLNFMAWKTKKLVFFETPIQQVCKDLSKYYGTEIGTSIADTNLKLSGSFYNEKLPDIIETIELTLDIKSEIQNEQIIFAQ